jgi:hypothetical protein
MAFEIVPMGDDANQQKEPPPPHKTPLPAAALIAPMKLDIFVRPKSIYFQYFT